MQQAIHDHNRRDDRARLSVRIGLSVGDVTIEPDGDCFGLPVVEAQRLEAARPRRIRSCARRWCAVSLGVVAITGSVRWVSSS